MESKDLFINVLGILSLLFLFYFVKKNKIFEKRWITTFYACAIINLAVIIIGILFYVFTFYEYRIPKELAKLLIFIISPFLPYILTHINNHKKNLRIFNHSLLVLNCIICIILSAIILIFNKDKNSIYFVLEDVFHTIVSIYLIVYSFISLSFKITFLKKEDRLFLSLVFLSVLINVFLDEVLNVNFLLFNYSATILLILYLFLLTVYLKVDILTNLPNRIVFEGDLKSIQSKQNIYIAIFDINNLKETNDTYGHYAGDRLIKEVSSMLSSCFTSGKCYRIGGDEFAYVGTQITEEKLKNMISNFINSVKNTDVAIGYASTDINNGIVETFKRADLNMYLDKTRKKDKK